MELANIEFYNTPDGQVCCKPLNEPMFILKEGDTELIASMLTAIQELYPSAFAALAEIYSRSELNKNYYQYKMVHRFIRCNFGEYDALSLDINGGGEFRMEDVRCVCLKESFAGRYSTPNCPQGRSRSPSYLHGGTSSKI